MGCARGDASTPECSPQQGGRIDRFIERFWLGSSGELLAEVINNTDGAPSSCGAAAIRGRIGAR